MSTIHGIAKLETLLMISLLLFLSLFGLNKSQQVYAAEALVLLPDVL